MFVIAALIVSVWINSGSWILKGLPPAGLHLASALVVLVVGAIASRLLERHVFRLSVDRLDAQSATTLKYLTRLVLYAAVVVAGLTALGVGLSSVVFGGAFLTVVIGLAGQTMFSNIIAGIWVIIFHPFKVGDTLAIVTWQFSQMPPTFPHEVLRPAYVGTVRDINLMYTEVQSADGYSQVIPNGIIVQAMLENRSRVRTRHVRIRFDAAFDYDSERLLQGLRQLLPNEFPELPTEPVVVVADIYPTAYSVAVTVRTHDPEEVVRSRVLSVALRVMRTITHENKQQVSAETPSADADAQ